MNTHKIPAEAHYSCREIAKERDTYRELCVELLNEIKTAVVYSENNIGAIDHLKAAITKAEAIMGEKK